MKELRLAKSVAYRMAEDIQRARRKHLEQLGVENAYFLFRLIDDLKTAGDLTQLESLSNRYERGQHHLGKHLGIEDKDVEKQVADEMAADLRRLRTMHQELVDEPITEERLRKAEQLLAACGEIIKLVDTGQVPDDPHLN